MRGFFQAFYSFILVCILFPLISVQDPQAQIHKLAAFLGIGENLELYREIIDKCSFQKMKHAKSSCDDEVEKADWREGKPMMYRKGDQGQLYPAEKREITQIFL